MNTYDVIVIGGGHAGCESALASARMGFKTAIFCLNLDTIAQMSCNPAIGGMAKGHLVREIDALGGEMAKAIDATGIQFRMLNTSKGPAVHSPRAQADKKAYHLYMKRVLEAQPNLDVKQGIVEELLIDNSKCVVGVKTATGVVYHSSAVIVATGTFLNGLIHIGFCTFNGGRAGDGVSEKLSESIRNLGFEMGRLKTGTNPRVHARSVKLSSLEKQYGDEPPTPFSFFTEKITQPQIPCYITYTNQKTHEVIRDNIDKSPLFRGVIKGVGPRYCPSIEDKVVRFADKLRHQIFLEPEGLQTSELYLNGLSTSLPEEIQLEFLHTITGLEEAVIMRPGYAVEYDFSMPTQLNSTMEAKFIENLYMAGQINGTSGYEEAAGQGLIAGINAGLKLKGKKPLILLRSEAYIGVLIDDLVTKGTEEPYRMFTSRAEYRLILRHDNADLRLMDKGFEIGLISEKAYQILLSKRAVVKKEKERLNSSKIRLTKETMEKIGLIYRPELEGKTVFWAEVLKLSEEPYQTFNLLNGDAQILSKGVIEQVVNDIKYKGYIERELKEIAKFEKLEHKLIPKNLNFYELKGLSKEAMEKLMKFKPESLGKASRISGVSAADITVLSIYLKKTKCFENVNKF